MNTLLTIGHTDSSTPYIDRPTVKVVIKKDNKVLILNDGLLPGGGIDPNESHHDAIARELQEELGVKVKHLREIGTIVQYRTYLKKRYLISGYSASLEGSGGATNPQDEGEAQFTAQWLTVEQAKIYVSRSIEEAKRKPMDNDVHQGKLYNLMTTLELLNHL